MITYLLNQTAACIIVAFHVLMQSSVPIISWEFYCWKHANLTMYGQDAECSWSRFWCSQARVYPKNLIWLAQAEAYTAEDAGVMELDDPAEAAAAARDPFTKLERGDADKRKAAEAARELSMLVADSRVKHRDDYAINKELRRRNRGLRKEEAGRDEQRRRLNLPDSIQLAPHSEQDRYGLEHKAVR